MDMLCCSGEDACRSQLRTVRQWISQPLVVFLGFCSGFTEWCVRCLRPPKEHGALKVVEHVNYVTSVHVLPA
uniref:Uncharacterized protein n=1 Tax=Aegilops tauschii subsp. strangulata TaxID=200361 RepID=A0A453HRL1_AEGTS